MQTCYLRFGAGADLRTAFDAATALNAPRTPCTPQTLDHWACVARPTEWRRWGNSDG
ncbi:hypothetical protein [Minwuia thermotolerans]|uniref:hypothetical protein n=1 Tax=Minwuia thermotolerans TaxID=2056226 RepID=UPI0013DDC883|nr:hypothetical protein [Minwuia thermotolerans]